MMRTLSKTKHPNRLCLLGALVLIVGLTSCAEHRDEVSETGTALADVVQREVDPGEVHLTLDGAGEEDLRGAVAFDVTGEALQRLSSKITSSTVQALCIIRSDKKDALGQYEDAHTVVPITLTVSDAGKKLRFEGSVTLNDHSKLVRNDSSRKWWIRAIICDPSRWQQVSGVYTGRIDYDVNRDGTQPFIGSQSSKGAAMHKTITELDVPFATDWYELEVRVSGTDPSTGGGIAVPTVMVFKPLGTLLRFIPQSSLPANNAHRNHGLKMLKITSKSFSPVGYFSLADTKPGDTDIPFTHTAPVEWTETFRTYRAAESNYGVPTDAAWFLPLWGMPRPEAQQVLGVEGLKVEAIIVTPTGEETFPTSYNSRYVTYNGGASGTGTLTGDYESDQSAKYRSDQTRGLKRKIQSGKNYAVRFTIIRPKMPLEFVSSKTLVWYNDNGTLKARLGGTEDTNLFRHSDMSNPNVIPAGMHAPNLQEWQAIFFNESSFNVKEYTTIRDNIAENVIFNGHNFYMQNSGDFRSAKVGNDYVLYGLRFKTYRGSKFRSAWRYHVTGDTNHVRVTTRCIYLGPFWNASITDIAREDWWSNNPIEAAGYNDPIDVKTFVTRGFYDGADSQTVNPMTVTKKYGHVTVYWNTSYQSPGNPWNFHLRLDNGIMGYYVESARDQRLFPLRPIYNNEPE